MLAHVFIPPLRGDVHHHGPKILREAPAKLESSLEASLNGQAGFRSFERGNCFNAIILLVILAHAYFTFERGCAPSPAQSLFSKRDFSR